MCGAMADFIECIHQRLVGMGDDVDFTCDLLSPAGLCDQGLKWGLHGQASDPAFALHGRQLRESRETKGSLRCSATGQHIDHSELFAVEAFLGNEKGRSPGATAPPAPHSLLKAASVISWVWPEPQALCAVVRDVSTHALLRSNAARDELLGLFRSHHRSSFGNHDLDSIVAHMCSCAVHINFNATKVFEAFCGDRSGRYRSMFEVRRRLREGVSRRPQLGDWVVILTGADRGTMHQIVADTATQIQDWARRLESVGMPSGEAQSDAKIAVNAELICNEETCVSLAQLPQEFIDEFTKAGVSQPQFFLQVAQHWSPSDDAAEREKGEGCGWSERWVGWSER